VRTVTGPPRRAGLRARDGSRGETARVRHAREAAHAARARRQPEGPVKRATCRAERLSRAAGVATARV